LTIFPGRYIAELPPSIAGPPNADQVLVVRSSIMLALGCSVLAATKTLPSVRVKTCG